MGLSYKAGFSTQRRRQHQILLPLLVLRAGSDIASSLVEIYVIVYRRLRQTDEHTHPERAVRNRCSCDMRGINKLGYLSFLEFLGGVHPPKLHTRCSATDRVIASGCPISVLLSIGLGPYILARWLVAANLSWSTQTGIEHIAVPSRP